MSERIIQILDLDSEADICRKEVLPKLYASKWTNDLILEQRLSHTEKLLSSVKKRGERKLSNLIIF